VGHHNETIVALVCHYLTIFANNIPSDILAQATFLDVAQVKNLKACFGGSN